MTRSNSNTGRGDRRLGRCRICGHPTFTAARLCGAHLDLLEDDWIRLADRYLDDVAPDPLESLPLMAADLSSEDTPPTSEPAA